MTLTTAPAASAAPRGAWSWIPARLRKDPFAARLAVIALAVASWEVAGHTVFDTDFISPPSAIVLAAPRVLGDPDVLRALWASFYQLVVAFGISLVAGVVIGAPIGLSRFTTRSLLPLILLAYSIPQVTVLPLFVLWFGIGSASKIAFGVSHGIFPIILNVIAGAQTIDEAHLKAARSMGATRMQILRRVVLPHMTPSLFAGLRLGMSATLLGVLLAELYASTGGIGYYTKLFSESFDPPATFTLVACLALMAIVLNETVRRAEKRASFWRNDGANEK